MTKIKTSSTNFVNKSLLSACPVTHVLNLIGGRWKALIVWNLLEGTMRFSELRDHIEMISEKMLIQQLRELEQDGIVKRDVFPVVPPKVEYSLTGLGKSLQPIMEQIVTWGLKNMEAPIVKERMTKKYVLQD
jgi:DNA-binding HxlR family transcriptional regulator